MIIKKNTCVEIISASNIRYVGTLNESDDKMITLLNVKNFGTEDREARIKVPSSNKIYDYMIFKKENVQQMTPVNKYLYGFYDNSSQEIKKTSNLKNEDSTHNNKDNNDLINSQKTFYDNFKI
ncbi:Scd6-like Sm domain-containing protein [Hamiltosporidium tvaerminnensis]|uniref:Scd6-like Sm domain-containing protein n=1 Tax=Hamiltosporidium tvaerminnensis TaxID=1176355 RepID=A0A4Q9M3L2_9MICR|nr:Scd6-like Sm domain-containing protein [Hamiltosporidium tvaerminnensis]